MLYESFAWERRTVQPGGHLPISPGGPGHGRPPAHLGLDDLEKHQELRRRVRGAQRVRFVQIHSPEYFKALATSRYLINNATFGADFVKRPDQVYVNTWHGVPLKHMGYDLKDGGLNSRNIVRNFLAADYLLSANPFMSDTMYREAYRLQGLYAGSDHRGRAAQDRPPARRPGQAGVRGARTGATRHRLRNRKVILYAPTWKGRSFQRPALNVRELLTLSVSSRPGGRREVRGACSRCIRSSTTPCRLGQGQWGPGTQPDPNEHAC